MNILPSQNSLFAELRHYLATDFVISVVGPAGVGKTTVTKLALKSYKDLTHAFINCDLVTTPSQLYINICQSILSKPLDKKKLSAVEFDSLLKKTKRRPIFVALDDADSLKAAGLEDALTAILANPSIRVIFISCSPIAATFATNQVLLSREIAEVRAPYWSKQDLTDMILKDMPISKSHHNLYKLLVSNFVMLHYGKTRNYLELSVYCRDNFERLMEYRNQWLDERKKKKLTGSDDNDDYDDDDEGAETGMLIKSFLKMYQEGKNKDQKDSAIGGNLDHMVVMGTSLLIVAAYIAAYTKPSDDKRNFVKLQKRKIVSSRTNTAPQKPSSRLFTMERLQQIYKALVIMMARGVSENNENTPGISHIPDSMLGDLETLEELGMLHVAVGDGISALTKYRLSGRIKPTYVNRLAQQLGLSLSDFHGLAAY